MDITSFKDMYFAELQELASMEEQLSQVQGRLAKIAAHPSLKHALTAHGRESGVQKERVVSMLTRHGATGEHTDQSVKALLAETEKMVAMVKNADLRDAALIASAQKIVHYEIAAYGTAAALADELDFRDDRALLRESLEEERKADERLTRIAKDEVNPLAMAK